MIPLGTCLEENAVAELAFGQLEPAEAARIDDHLRRCRDCKALYRELSRATSPGDPPAGIGLPETMMEWESGDTPPPEPDDTGVAFRPGEVLAGKYRFDRVIGSGGMGAVVRATHLELDQPVALKFMLPGVADNAQVVARFKREARAAAQLRGEHVGRVLDIGHLDTGELFIVMEYLEGESLAALMRRRGKLSPQKAAMLIMHACEGIGEAHSVGIVHRDLKPSNLFLAHRPNGTPCLKVLDFGIAKFDSGGPVNLSLTHTQMMLGSPRYMSPEQLLRPREVDGRADIWSLGVILYQLLSGEPPFDADTVPKMIARVLNDSPPPVSSLASDVSPALDKVVATCLQRDPDLRYRTASQLRDALAPFAKPEGTSVDRPGPRRRWWLAAIGVGAVAAGGIALAVAVRSGDESASKPTPAVRGEVVPTANATEDATPARSPRADAATSKPAPQAESETETPKAEAKRVSSDSSRGNKPRRKKQKKIEQDGLLEPQL